jgi:hypothetical protein
MAIYYLDVDDEITSAATRIRDTSDNRIALVLTAGSRVATSRINFLLLAREARRRNKRLAIVTSDPSTQSVARSADLSVYGTVGEYERAEAARIADPTGAAAAAGTRVAPGSAGDTSAALGELARTVTTPSNRVPAGSPSRTSASGRFRRLHVPWPAVAAALFAVILLVASGLFFLYPSATVTVTLQEQPVGPLALNVTVDPRASAVNDQSAIIPGLDKAFPLEASGTYTATGEQVVDTAAAGTVTFSSINTLFSVPVVAGTQVSTRGGIAFTTTATVNVPAATVSGTTINFGTAQASIVAVEKGTAGNVAANTITRLPSDLAAAKLSVTNAAATIGGTHTVNPAIAQADIDAAASDLLNRLNSSFQAAIAAPAAHPAGSNLFDETAHMSVAVCNPDPAALVGLAQQTFDLTCTATGTATIADMANVKNLAERRITDLVSTGYSLVGGSVKTTLGTPALDGGSLVVPVTATASEVRKVNVDQLRNGIMGKSVTDARRYLQGFGSVSMSLSPGWADTMPAFDFRIDVQLVVPTAAPASTPSAGESPPLATPTERPVPTVRPTPPPETPTPAGASGTASPSPTASPTPTPLATSTPTPTTAPTFTPSPSPPASPSPS